MRIGVLTDIHGNREALQAVLEDCVQRGVDRHAVLGDIVGYGPDPEWCVDRVRAMADADAIVLKGNHDQAIDQPSQAMNPIARAALDWTRPRLTAEQRAFLASLPMKAELGDALFVHASAHSPADWLYVTSPRSAMPCFRVSTARVIFCGHVHAPALYSCDLAERVHEHPPRIGGPVPLLTSRRWLAVVGSVGQPRDGVAQAAYAIFDSDRNELTFRRVPCDMAMTARKVLAAGLPAPLAARLTEGR